MNTVKIKVTAQLFENYSDTDIPYWKAKFAPNFIFKVPDGFAIYEPEMVTEFAKTALEMASNDHERFEYLSHEVFFQDDFSLQDEVDKLINNQEFLDRKRKEIELLNS